MRPLPDGQEVKAPSAKALKSTNRLRWDSLPFMEHRFMNSQRREPYVNSRKSDLAAVAPTTEN